MMSSTLMLSMTKWLIGAASKLVKAHIHIYNAAAIREDMAIIYVVNHFTRLETVLLPYLIYKHTGQPVAALADAALFQGRIGELLRITDTLSTRDPNRDHTVIRTLLHGAHPWLIFPEGAMVKDKKVVDDTGDYRIFHDTGRRLPHTGAAVLALRAEQYRQQIRRAVDSGQIDKVHALLEQFGIEDVQQVLHKRTVIVPVNITYYPIRAHDNFLLRVAAQLKEELSPRMLEELSVEGTVLSEDTDMDIVFGMPISVQSYLEGFPESQESPAFASQLQQTAKTLMLRYMHEIYQLTTINYDHIFATLLRYIYPPRFTERIFRQRAFLVAHQLRQLRTLRLHTQLADTYRALLDEETHTPLENFMREAIREGRVHREGRTYTVREAVPPLPEDHDTFHQYRLHAIDSVIAHELEPLTEAMQQIRRIARQPHARVAQRIRRLLINEDLQQFEDEYARFYHPELSKRPEIGRPFLLRPHRIRGGVMLSHGYMAAPQEIRALAEFLYQRHYAVYGIRLPGHGTSPENLAQCTWQQWYEALNCGYAILKTLTNKVYLGGFSTGGCLALAAAARKHTRVRAVFSICAPLRLQNYSVRLAPSIVSLNALLRRFNRDGWEYVDNHPENPHINYTRNPLTGVKELMKLMHYTEQHLADVHIPTLVMQASKDITVDPVSAQLIFEKLGTVDKELSVFERNRHGIVNHEGAEAVFARVYQFLERVRQADKCSPCGPLESVANED